MPAARLEQSGLSSADPTRNVDFSMTRALTASVPFPMTTTAIDRPLRLAGVPAGSWAFGIRIWLAVVVALSASFWLELEVPSTAAVTVAILAQPTRGRAVEKACFRLIATVIGVTAAKL